MALGSVTGNATEYRHKDKIVEIIDEAKANINRLYMELRRADTQEREVLYARIADEKARRDMEVSKWLMNKNVLMLVLRHYEKNSAADWRIYAALVNPPIFSNLVWNYFERERVKIIENKRGNYSLYGIKFAKI